MNFERGKDPKETIGLGYKEILKSMKRCLLITEKNLYQNVNHQYYNIETIETRNIAIRKEFLYDAFIIIIIVEDKFRIMKNRFSNDNSLEIYPIKDLPEMTLKLKKLYDYWAESNLEK